MRRLSSQIYLTFVGILVLFGLVASILWVALPLADNRLLSVLTAVASEWLAAQEASIASGPDTEDGRRASAEALSRLGARTGLELSLWTAGGELLASYGDTDTVRPPRAHWRESRWASSRRAGLALGLALKLDDGRWLVVRHERGAHAIRGAALLFALVVAVGVGSFPLVRRLSRRIERLREQVVSLGSGHLGARVEVEGNDEVAELAGRFNDAAQRIERLVEAQRSFLAAASHELRSPLARLRLGIEMLSDSTQRREPSMSGAEVDFDTDAGADTQSSEEQVRAMLVQDVRELDSIIDELMLASRLDALDAFERGETVDLLGLVAEAASSYDFEIQLSGESVELFADPALIRRLVKNLFDNAGRHAGGVGVEAHVSRSRSPTTDGATLVVADRGPGVPEEERERILEPFHRGLDTRASEPPESQRRSEGSVSGSGAVRARSRGPGLELGLGLGLGLALVDRIARHHGGAVRCLPREDADGRGARFEVDLVGLLVTGDDVPRAN